MKVVTSDEMRRIDEIAIKEYNIPSLSLMEDAGRSVYKHIKSIYSNYKKAIVFCGSGNNGGDGMVVARYLKRDGWEVKVILLSENDKLTEESKEQLKKIKRLKIPVIHMDDLEKIDKMSVIVDAIFGTGIKREITGKIKQVIERINQSGMPVISVDIPSGVSGDDGSIMGTAVKADITVTLGLPKRGHFLYPGAEHTGRLIVEYIGFPQELLISEDLKVSTIDKDYVKSIIPVRKRYSHKGTYGHVLIVAGSRGRTGAALMAGRAALRIGAGMVTLGVPESLLGSFQSAVLEEMCLPLPDRDGIICIDAFEDIMRFLHKRADILAVGPGIGVNSDTRELMRRLITSSPKPVVIDADGINSIEDPEILISSRSEIVLTPHPGEFSRLTDITVNEIERDRISHAISFVERYRNILILKGVPTVISWNRYAWLNTTGNPGMAKAGSGDVLTGIVAGLIAQGMRPLQASISGVYIHGLSGDIASRRFTNYSLLARDIIDLIPEAFMELLNE